MRKEDTKLSSDFTVAETDNFIKKINKKEFRILYEKIKGCIYPQLQVNPFFSKNVKKLKGSLHGLFRYRIGDYRLFYTIDSERKIVFIVDIDHRKDIYRS